MRLAIIGCGRVARKRAQSIRAAGHELIACGDVVYSNAEAIAQEFGTRDCFAGTDRGVLTGLTEQCVDAVIVATPHDALAWNARMAAEQSCHVLIEKPGARRAAELEPVRRAAATSGVVVHVGFNHRYHPAISAAHKLVHAGAIGRVFQIRGVYGHGGRAKYQSEWRFIPKLSGGGEGLDQGCHLVDLTRWFLGDLTLIGGWATNFYWGGPVEDNALFVLQGLKAYDTQGAYRFPVATLAASWTEWRNTFSFEIFGSRGKIAITGLGGSYGPEKLAWSTFGADDLGKPPATETREFTGADDSWDLEFRDFLNEIQTGRQPASGIVNAQANLRVVEDLYRHAGLEYPDVRPELLTQRGPAPSKPDRVIPIITKEKLAA